MGLQLDMQDLVSKELIKLVKGKEGRGRNAGGHATEFGPLERDSLSLQSEMSLV